MNSLIEVDLNSIVHNLSAIRKIIYPETKIIGVVKANAYGHGLVETARAIWTSGADQLATWTIDEAVELRVNKIKSPILVLGYVDPKHFYKALEFDLTLTGYDLDVIYLLHLEAKKHNRWAKIDFEVDTGMNRLGFKSYEASEKFLEVAKFEHIKIEGIHSHYADALDPEFSSQQLREFQNVLFSLQQQRITIPMAHMAATNASYLYSESQLDAIRIGLGLYGYSEIPELQANFSPVLSWKSHVIALKRVAKGESVSYNRLYKAASPRKIAIAPVGYADGYPRSLSNKSEVIIGGARAKVIGFINMNAMMIDVTGISCRVGEEVILIGSQKEESVTAISS